MKKHQQQINVDILMGSGELIMENIKKKKLK